MERHNVRPYCVTNSLTYCFMMWAMAELTAQTAIWGLGYRRKGNGEREGEVSKGVSLVTIQPFAWEKKRFLWYHKSAHITWPLTSTLTLSTFRIQANMVTIMCKFDGDPAILSGRSVLHDLWARPWPWACPRDHLVQVWSRSSHLSGRRSDLRTCLQTNGWMMHAERWHVAYSI